MLIHLGFLYALPLIVVVAGLSAGAALVFVLGMLLWRWALVLIHLFVPSKAPALQLDTISASHFVEKVRWCMDYLGLEYTERPMGGVLGVIFLGRTVPRLRFRTGTVESAIGNSPEILRYLWGRYAVEMPKRVGFLEPTAERLALERRIDRVGADLQVWVYFHILNDRALTEHAWGCDSPAIPAYQRWALRLLFPVLRRFIRKAFRISLAHHAKAVQHIEALLGDAEQRLADGRQSLLGGDEINFVDISFAAISGLWLQPTGYGGGKADDVRVDFERAPVQMQHEISRWRKDYPHTVAFIERLYLQNRSSADQAGP